MLVEAREGGEVGEKLKWEFYTKLQSESAANSGPKVKKKKKKKTMPCFPAKLPADGQNMTVFVFQCSDATLFYSHVPTLFPD